MDSSGSEQCLMLASGKCSNEYLGSINGELLNWLKDSAPQS
jgi:hypothetical protein